MMTERGFVTVFALCLVIVVALIVKGIQESETNHNYEAADLQAQFDLQSAADGGIYEAAEKVRNNKDILPASNFAGGRKENQKLLVSRTVKISNRQIRVDVWGERLRVQHYERLYPSYKKSARGGVEYGYALISVAELDSPRFGKVYRRAFAYVVDGYGKNTLNEIVEPDENADEYTVHFMTLP
ncbi:MAG: hypothetical protein IJ774_14410 [Selenomonadaceae bacterium]|nr:hypothetical protein [Selenomonadaceae bacterium]